MYYDTIAAICTALSPSGINVIRISGEDAFSIAQKVFRHINGKSVAAMKPFSVNYGHIVDQDEVIDEVLLLKMKAPKSYTREDVIEIDCHGGIVVTKKILRLILKNGARLAEPGEFTKRAFLNGRIDLSQAEAVIDIINSKNEMALKNSIAQLSGSIKEKISVLRERILSKTAYIEAALDDPEHISLEGFSEELMSELKNIKTELEKIADSFNSGRFLQDGIKTVILGRPNAGKSSLLNRLTGEEKAIVTDIAGTTRDAIEEYVNLSGILLKLVDTAGIRDTENPIEKIGVEKANEFALCADLILYVVDSSSEISNEDIDILKRYSDKKIIALFNKSDVKVSEDHSLISNTFKDMVCIDISAKTGEGIELLKDTISEMFFSGNLNAGSEVILTNERHKNLIDKTIVSIKQVINSIENNLPEDFYSIDMMDAYTFLGLITGDNVEDDLADKIFSDFCMGK